MFSFSCLISVAGLLSVVRAWDVAVTTMDRKVQFYNESGAAVSAANFEGAELSALAYDAATDLLLLIDELNLNDTIFRILFATDNHTQPLVRKQPATVRSLAFDPVTDTIFWIAGRICSMSLSDARSNGHGETVVAHRGDYTGLAVDSCGGYIYWSEFALKNSTIKRAKLDGSEARVIIGSDLYTPVGLAVDHSARRLYWVDDSEGVYYKIESSDLNGNDRRTLAKEFEQQPRDIAVGEHYVYWTDELHKCIWRTPKNANQDTKPVKFVEYKTGATPLGLAVKYDLTAQIDKNPHCEALKQILGRSQNYLAGIIETSLKKRNGACVHGALEQGGCDCRPGYSGERCEVRSCHLCAQGRCDGAEMSLCEKNKTAHIEATTAQISPQFDRKIANNETPKQTKSPGKEAVREVKQIDRMESLGSTDGVFVESAACSGDEWDVKDPIIMALGTLCGLLSIACAVLITKIVNLKKRPRIKRRIIVNKNVTPLTARPEQQCEITIENCCNMNICETPCFEPRSTIRPTLIGAKAGKEEKKNLIANMEHPDDIY